MVKGKRIVKLCGTSYLGDRDLSNHGVLAECGGAHEVVQLLALTGKPAGAIWHHSCPLRGS